MKTGFLLCVRLIFKQFDCEFVNKNYDFLIFLCSFAVDSSRCRNSGTSVKKKNKNKGLSSIFYREKNTARVLAVFLIFINFNFFFIKHSEEKAVRCYMVRKCKYGPPPSTYGGQCLHWRKKDMLEFGKRSFTVANMANGPVVCPTIISGYQMVFTICDW